MYIPNQNLEMTEWCFYGKFLILGWYTVPELGGLRYQVFCVRTTYLVQSKDSFQPFFSGMEHQN